MTQQLTFKSLRWRFEIGFWETHELAVQYGWELKRVKSSHHVYIKSRRQERVVIPIHGNRSLKLGLQRALMKIIPVDESEL